MCLDTAEEAAPIGFAWAKAKFAELYQDKTGNNWEAIRDGTSTFKKRPAKFYPVGDAQFILLRDTVNVDTGCDLT